MMLLSLLAQVASTYLPEPSEYCAKAPSTAPVEGNGPLDVIGADDPAMIVPPPTGVRVSELMVMTLVGAEGSSSTTPCAQPALPRHVMAMQIATARGTIEIASFTNCAVMVAFRSPAVAIGMLPAE
jgi:hypothetical protein